MPENLLVGGARAERILGASKTDRRNLQRAGRLRPYLTIDGRDLYLRTAVEALRAQLDLEEAEALRSRLNPQRSQPPADAA